MPNLPGVNHRRAVRALERAGFRILREGKHITMSDGARTVVVPRSNPINGYTMATIIFRAGLTIDEFKKLL
jgi:predicted RNA binding protein YcfA (HicA-like mRNA interferase family)